MQITVDKDIEIILDDDEQVRKTSTHRLPNSNIIKVRESTMEVDEVISKSPTNIKCSNCII